MGQLAKLTRIISRDNVMRNITSAEQLLSFLFNFELHTTFDRSHIMVLLIGNGFRLEIANSIIDEVGNLENILLLL